MENNLRNALACPARTNGEERSEEGEKIKRLSSESFLHFLYIISVFRFSLREKTDFSGGDGSQHASRLSSVARENRILLSQIIRTRCGNYSPADAWPFPAGGMLIHVFCLSQSDGPSMVIDVLTAAIDSWDSA